MNTPESKVDKLREARKQVDHLLSVYRKQARTIPSGSTTGLVRDFITDLEVLEAKLRDPLDDLMVDVKDASERLAARIDDLQALRRPILNDLEFILDTLKSVENALKELV